MQRECTSPWNFTSNFTRFLLVAFQLEYIFKSREPMKRLRAVQDVLKTLSSAYEDIMVRIENSSPDDKELSRRSLARAAVTQISLDSVVAS